ncbi:MAG: ABC transporter ATP-binding protein [Methanomassiliicoccales archaeon]|nr:ABC transporter ATP-binding protein [Methanomassiliicoccales archaeon]
MVADGANIVSVQGLYKRYKDLPVLLNLSFDVPRRSVFGFIGPNGAGKTTTIKIITGLLHDFQGDVMIQGSSVRQRDLASCASIGYLPQRTTMQEWRTVDQALNTFGRLSGMEGDDVKKRTGEVLDVLGISEHRHRKVGKLSGGTLQKVGMAQAMLHRPELMILDEPVAGLDPESRVLFKNLFRQLAKDGATVFFSSHILSDVEDIANNIGILGQGRMGYCGSMDGLRERVQHHKEVRLELVEQLNDIQMLSRIPAVSTVERISGNEFMLRFQNNADIDAAIDKCIRDVLGAGMHIRSIRPTHPSLEELYLSYTKGGMV